MSNILEKDQSLAGVFAAANRKFEFDVLRTLKPLCYDSKTGEIIRISALEPWVDNNKRIIARVIDKVNEDWVIFSIRGQEIAWALPGSVLQQFLEQHPLKMTRRGDKHWTFWIGQRDGRNRVWFGYDYKRGDFIDIDQYEIPILRS
jgi:hypothetical protein